MAHSYDVCVLGAGPAALSVSSRLVDLGREVAVVDRSVTVRPWGGESFTAAIRAPLAALGLWEAFAEAGHVRGYERQVSWGGDPISESSPLSRSPRHAIPADLARCTAPPAVAGSRCLPAWRMDGEVIALDETGRLDRLHEAIAERLQGGSEVRRARRGAGANSSPLKLLHRKNNLTEPRTTLI